MVLAMVVAVLWRIAMPFRDVPPPREASMFLVIAAVSLFVGAILLWCAILSADPRF